MVTRSVTRCEWCINPETEDISEPENLCDNHAAEYDGVTVAQLDLQAAGEWYDTL